jgi:hypothetical protein
MQNCRSLHAVCLSVFEMGIYDFIIGNQSVSRSIANIKNYKLRPQRATRLRQTCVQRSLKRCNCTCSTTMAHHTGTAPRPPQIQTLMATIPNEGSSRTHHCRYLCCIAASHLQLNKTRTNNQSYRLVPPR